MKKDQKQAKGAAATGAGASAKRKPGPTRSAATPVSRELAAGDRPAARSEELRIKITPALKQQFKRAAKEQKLKKGEFLERLMTAWLSAQPKG